MVVVNWRPRWPQERREQEREAPLLATMTLLQLEQTASSPDWFGELWRAGEGGSSLKLKWVVRLERAPQEQKPSAQVPEAGTGLRAVRQSATAVAPLP